MSFDDIPEDHKEAWPCPVCEHGEVSLYHSGCYECDTCNFVKPRSIPSEQENQVKE